MNNLISKYINTSKRITTRGISLVSAAASVILLIGLFLLIEQKRDVEKNNKVAEKTMIEKNEKKQEVISEAIPVTGAISVKLTKVNPETKNEKEPLQKNILPIINERSTIAKPKDRSTIIHGYSDSIPLPEPGYEIKETENQSESLSPVASRLTNKKPVSNRIQKTNIAENTNYFPGNEIKQPIFYEQDDEVFLIVEEMPKFRNGGLDKFAEYVYSNLSYPEEAKLSSIQGKSIINFIVDTLGKVTEVKVIRSIDPVIDKEIVRVIQSSPPWVPGKQRRVKVNVSFTLPVTFKQK